MRPRLLVTTVVASATLIALGALATEEQELVLEEVRVEAEPFDARLELQREPVVTEFIARLQLRADEERARELALANQSAATHLLELTRYIPIPLGSSGSAPDTFFQQNYLRADLNPSRANALLDR
ncbi:MAG: hypothetical protein ABI883_08970 [Chthoniobacterales bacterium]